MNRVLAFWQWLRNRIVVLLRTSLYRVRHWPGMAVRAQVLYNQPPGGAYLGASTMFIPNAGALAVVKYYDAQDLETTLVPGPITWSLAHQGLFDIAPSADGTSAVITRVAGTAGPTVLTVTSGDIVVSSDITSVDPASAGGAAGTPVPPAPPPTPGVATRATLTITPQA